MGIDASGGKLMCVHDRWKQEWARTPPGAAVVVASSNNDGTVCVHELRDEGAELVEVAGVRELVLFI